MTAQGEQRMLIDGELVLADSGATFDNVNPATEEVLGQVADASTVEMHRAIDAARRAFDETAGRRIARSGSGASNSCKKRSRRSSRSSARSSSWRSGARG